jgi:glucose/arabinose dehydrogenase/PKD repeat protein
MRRLALLLAPAVALLLVTAVWLAVSTVKAAPPGFTNQTWIVGLDQPTALAFTPDGRLFIAQRTGAVQVVMPGGTVVEAAPLLTLTNLNTDEGERGLVGMALDPAFADNGWLYLFYTANTPLRDRVARFTVISNTAPLTSEVVIWQDNVDAGLWHHGGGLAFGPDGKLYISTGDHFDQTAGGAHSSQRLDSYHGKLLRLNPDGSVPPDNPFFDGAGPNLDAIWALGLRNPFRFTFDFPTGRLYIGDVGGNNQLTSVEELNLGSAGANYGWPICEGACSTAGFTDPLFSYSHGGHDASIIAGFVYHGAQFPAAYGGSLFYADYAQRWIKRLTFDANGAVTGNENFEPLDGALFGPYGDIVDLKPGPEGALYYADIALDLSGVPHGPGSIRKITYSSDNQPPVITAAWADPMEGPGPTLTVAFSATATDADNDPLAYHWTFGDGQSAPTANPTHTYEAKGVFFARLAVSDTLATTLSDPIQIVVGQRPIVTVTAPVSGSLFRAGEVITFSAAAADPDGLLSSANFAWTILFHHENHVHPAEGPIIGESGTFTIPVDGHDFSGHTAYEAIVAVTDADGIVTSDSRLIYPDKVNLTFATAPVGLALNFDQQTNVAAPFVRDTLINFRHTIGAALTQTLGGELYQFVGWSDGGTATHTLTVPAQAQTYTATYQPAGAPAACPPGQCVYLPLMRR